MSLRAITENFVAKRVTNEGMLPKLNPTEVVGIIFLHKTYQDAFMTSVSVDLESYCKSQTDTWSLDTIWLKDDPEVEEKFPDVCCNFYSNPVLTISTIHTFHDNIVTEEYLSDHCRMNGGLLKILNSILTETKKTFESQLEGNKDVIAAMRKSFIPAVYAAAAPYQMWGSELECDVAIRLNRDSTNTSRVAVADLSETQLKLGKQVAALSKDVIATKLDKSEEVLLIKRLDIIPRDGTFNAKFNSVMSFFSPEGQCPLYGIKEMYALSLDKRIVYIRFWTKRAKYNAEAKLKLFKSQNPRYQFMYSLGTFPL